MVTQQDIAVGLQRAASICRSSIPGLPYAVHWESNYEMESHIHWILARPGSLHRSLPVAKCRKYANHDMLGEKRMPDEQIAGTTAIHFRHERSPQSYAGDRYFFIHGTQLSLVIVGHGDVEDWDQSSRFLQSIKFE